MSASCVRFRRVDAAALDVIGEAAAKAAPAQLMAAHEAAPQARPRRERR